jgi:hypothetical protein
MFTLLPETVQQMLDKVSINGVERLFEMPFPQQDFNFIGESERTIVH